MINPAELAYLLHLTSAEETRQRNIVLARDYYEGDHHVPLTLRQRQYLGFAADQKFAVNYCRMIVATIAERLHVLGFDGDNALTEFAEAEWVRARLQAHANRLHRYILTDGCGYVITDWHNGAPRYTVQRAYTDAELGGTGEGCKAHYVNDDVYSELEYVSKRWTETYYEGGMRHTRRRLTIYAPDSVEKYALAGSSEATWKPYRDKGDASWPLPWVDRNGEPLGIAATPFQNVDGQSELTTEILALNDALNKVWLDILAAADRAGYGIYIGRGVWPTTDGSPPNAENSNVVRIAPGVWIGVKDPASTVEMLNASDLSQLLNVKDSLEYEMAQVSGIPVTRLQVSRQVAAEGTLKQQEAGLVAKVKDRHVLYGDGWENVMRLGARLDQSYGSRRERARPDDVIETQWDSAEMRDEDAMIERASKMVRELKIPYEIAWKYVGFADEEIERMKTMEPYASMIAGQLAMAQAAMWLDEGNRGS